LLPDHSPAFTSDFVHVIGDFLRLGNVRCPDDRNPADRVLPHGQPFSEKELGLISALDGKRQGKDCHEGHDQH
jgi:hypothetical protein